MTKQPRVVLAFLFLLLIGLTSSQSARAQSGITQKNNLGGLAMVLPMKVLGSGDGTWDANAWKTDAFYGNPLNGFLAPSNCQHVH